MGCEGRRVVDIGGWVMGVRWEGERAPDQNLIEQLHGYTATQPTVYCSLILIKLPEYTGCD